MSVLSPDKPSVQNDYLRKERMQTPWDTHSFVKKHMGVDPEDAERQAKLDEERLQQWRMRVKQIRGR